MQISIASAQPIGTLIREGEHKPFKASACPIRALDSKCKFDRPPGFKAGGRRPRATVYGTQLREKQKLRHMYGLMEKQFHSYYLTAARSKAATGEKLLQLLESMNHLWL